MALWPWVSQVFVCACEHFLLEAEAGVDGFNIGLLATSYGLQRVAVCILESRTAQN